MSEKNKKNKNQSKNVGKKDEKSNKQNTKDTKVPQKKNENKTLNLNKIQGKPTPKDVNVKNVSTTSTSENVTQPEVENVSQRGKYSKRKIEKNFERPELPENTYEVIENASKGVNMMEILNKPISVGDHFQFKHEKSWNYNAKYSEENDLFVLDLDKIADHISCVPFHVRNDLEQSLFSDDQMQWMKRVADIKLMSAFTETPKIDNLKLSDDVEKHFESSLSKISKPNINKESKSAISKAHKTDELDELLNFTPKTNPTIEDNIQGAANNLNNPVHNIKPPAEDDNLEEWLEEYLGS